MNTSTSQGPKCVASPATPCFAMVREATVHSSLSLSLISVATWVQDVTTHLNNPGWENAVAIVTWSHFTQALVCVRLGALAFDLICDGS